MDYTNKGYNNGNLWPLDAYNGIKEVNSGLGIKVSDQSVISDMWNYSGGISVDEEGNAKPR
jgi:hypothetical protein